MARDWWKTRNQGRKRESEQQVEKQERGYPKKAVGGGEGLGSTDGVTHLELSNRQRMPKTDTRLDRGASISVDLLRGLEVDARPLAACRRQLQTTLSKGLTTGRGGSHSSVMGKQFPCLIFLMLFTSKSGCKHVIRKLKKKQLNLPQAPWD